MKRLYKAYLHAPYSSLKHSMPYTASYKDALFLWISVNGTHTYRYIYIYNDAIVVDVVVVDHAVIVYYVCLMISHLHRHSPPHNCF